MKTRKMKRFATIAAIAMIASCMAAPMAAMNASAAAGEITFNNATVGTHTYTAYRVFKGNAGANGFGGTAQMTNLDWDMSDDNAAKFLAALKADARFNTTTGEPGAEVTTNDFATCTVEDDVAGVLANYQYDSAKARAFAEFVVEHKNLLANPAGTTSASEKITLSGDTNDGYYVIEETNIVDGGAKTAYLLGVYDATVGAEVNVKSKTPEFEKKIMDKNDSDLADTTSDTWKDSADYDINDSVPFKLTASLPGDYNSYNQYKLVFHDNLDSKGDDAAFSDVTITSVFYDANGDGVYTDGTDTTIPVQNGATSGYILTEAADDASLDAAWDCDFEVEIPNLKVWAPTTTNGKVVVLYTAKLTNECVIGEDGNWNTAYLEYSNDMYYESEGTDGKDNDNDGTIDEEDEQEDKNGKDDDGDGTPDNEEEKPDDQTTSESNKDTVVAFTYQLDVDKIKPDGELLTGAKFQLYKWKDTTDPATPLNKTGEWVTVGEEQGGEAVSQFSWKGLDAGKYKIVETKEPGGYNKLKDPIEFVVAATHTDETIDPENGTVIEPALTVLTVNDAEGTSITATDWSAGKFTAVVADGVVATKVINNAGLVLPGTGGIGTTIFYVVGGTMAAGAGVYLISKKRMKKDEE
ncbi:MAG: isopeptide-forming domain-containing fimbrial protein [Ruminococcus sp.]|nr:isopeptide-forming domain-containing fimbrial protein [Ruminococcus sp.]